MIESVTHFQSCVSASFWILDFFDLFFRFPVHAFFGIFGFLFGVKGPKLFAPSSDNFSGEIISNFVGWLCQMCLFFDLFHQQL